MHDHSADPPIESRVGDALVEAGHTVAVAETVTGGLIGTLLTDTPGASAYLDRVLVPYDYDALRDLLAVDRETLDDHGAVSAETTAELAKAARDTADATWGVATTGVAGPEGGSEAKPVGTAFVAVAYAGSWESHSSVTTVERYGFDGDRASVREQAARQALDDLLAAVERRA